MLTHLGFLVPVAGVEPARYRYQRILSPPRLPIPTHRRVVKILYYIFFKNARAFFAKNVYARKNIRFYIVCLLWK